MNAWLAKYPEKYSVDIVGAKHDEWKLVNFSNYETVIDFVGIAHVKNITSDMMDLFYSVNRDLSLEIAMQAKKHGVKHFIIFSSMNVYGDFCDNITDRNAENPTSFYGDSKLQGDKEIKKIEDEAFKVAYIRPPFVYGKGCRGNYNTIRKFALLTPIFPTYKNKKSMIYIDNLCEFVRLVIDNKIQGILTPQNKEIVSTTDLVRELAKCHNKKILFIGCFDWIIKYFYKYVKIVKKAFANDYYPCELSSYWGGEYCVVTFEESIKKTEL